MKSSDAEIKRHTRNIIILDLQYGSKTFTDRMTHCVILQRFFHSSLRKREPQQKLMWQTRAS